MLYIKALALDRFKSFKHAELLFDKGFNAIVGANGSGKSNICDAMLFCLGENSLHRLRASRLDDLIYNEGKKNTATKAYVRLEFGGEEQIEITRSLSSDGKSTYKVNGKHLTRQETVELLSTHRIYADERNTVAQGEIGKITELNAKERRELIDAVAGIMEFERKKDEALKELDKVNMKISEMQGIFQERLGFLKELEKEKEIAERYSAMATRLKQLNYSALLARISITQSTIESYQKDMETLQNQKAEEEASAKKLYDALSSVNAERQELTKSIEENTKQIGNVNELLQKLSAQLAESLAKIANYASEIEAVKKERTEKQEALKATELSINSNENAITQLSKELETLEGRIPKSSHAQEMRTMKGLTDKISTLEEQEKSIMESIAKLDLECALYTSKEETAKAELNDLKTRLKVLEDEHETIERAAKLAKSNIEASAHEVEKQNERLNELVKLIDEKGAKVLELKEQRAMNASRENQSKEALLRAFDASSGVYGTVGDLCEYEEQYVEAVEAAAGSRLDYIIVDNIDTAGKAIAYLKSKGIGKATFIPLQEIRVAQPKAVEAKSLLSVVSYDKRFEKAFTFVFGNTYIVNTLQEAKALGIGTCRYVTLDGELVESSGLVSGGSNKKSRMTLHSINSMLKQLDADMSQLLAEKQQLDAKLFELKKGIASEEIRLNILGDNLTNVTKQQTAMEEQAKALNDEIARQETLKANSESQKKELAIKLGTITNELADAKAKLKEVYSALGKDDTQQEASSEAEELQKKAESTRIKIAELRKENQMLNAKKAEIENSIEKASRAIAETEKMLSEERNAKNTYEKEKNTIEEQIRNSGKVYREAYDKINELEHKAIEISKQLGESGSRSKELESEIKEIQIKKGQLDVRLNDLRAELAAYEQGIEVIKDKSIDEMEKEAGALSMQIQELGTVNMKAPEVYALKKKEVDDAQSKLYTLETERRSVLGLIDEVDKKKLAAFMSTFTEIEKNFEKMYKYIFPGEARLVLDNEKDPFSGGLEIKITGTNRKGELVALSGGEKALVSLMLLFAIHMYKPASL
ncbi:MAG: chromosome segregation SMC family protein, partial [Candidatus Micrarchaeaceae archaeon]